MHIRQQLVLVALLLSCLRVDGRAGELVWNGGVDGVWSNRGSGWLNGTAPGYWNNEAADTAVFDGAAGGTVTIDGAGIVAGGLEFVQGDFVLEESGTLKLQGGSISVADGVSATIGAAMGGSGGFTKLGDGMLKLEGNNKFYTGPTVIKAGAVRIDGAEGGQLGADLAVELDGGALEGAFETEMNVPHKIRVGDAGGVLRLDGSEKGRWNIAQDSISGSGELTLSFGEKHGRFKLPSTLKEFTGTWVVDSGGDGNRFVDVWKPGSFGAASGDEAITLLNKGTLMLRHGLVLGSDDQGITVGQGGAKFVVAHDAAVKIAGAIRGGADEVQFFLGNEKSTVILANPRNAWAGKASLINTGIVQLGASGVLPDASTLWVSPTVILDLNGQSEGVGLLAGYGTVDNTAPGSKVALTVGLSGANGSFDGRVLSSGAGSHMMLVKDGAGAVQFAGELAFEGGIVAKSGRLAIQGRSSVPVTVMGGATLSGTGSVGRVVVKSGGILSPGGVGTLSAGSLALEMGSKLQMDLGSTNSVHDSVSVSNEVVLNGQQFQDFAFAPGKGFGEGVYTLVRASSIRGSLGTDKSGKIQGFNARITVKDNDVLLDVSR